MIIGMTVPGSIADIRIVPGIASSEATTNPFIQSFIGSTINAIVGPITTQKENPVRVIYKSTPCIKPGVISIKPAITPMVNDADSFCPWYVT
jgi:hypothetical protein